MAQISRPFQLALVLVAVLALAWFTVLHAHLSTNGGGSSSSGSSAPSASTTSKTSKAGEIEHNEGKATPVYHGAAPGLQGLSKDIRRAHEAVGASQTEAHKLEGGSAAAGAAPGAASHASAPATQAAHTVSAAPSHASSTARHHIAAAAHPPATVAHARNAGASGSQTSRATTVQSQLQAGKVVLLLFWNPRSSADQGVHAQVQAAGRSLKSKVALDFAKAGEVGSFGTVTRDVSVLQTPTLLIINQKGLATTITGLTDAFSIEQAVREAGA